MIIIKLTNHDYSIEIMSRILKDYWATSGDILNRVATIWVLFMSFNSIHKGSHTSVTLERTMKCGYIKNMKRYQVSRGIMWYSASFSDFSGFLIHKYYQVRRYLVSFSTNVFFTPETLNSHFTTEFALLVLSAPPLVSHHDYLLSLPWILSFHGSIPRIY